MSDPLSGLERLLGQLSRRRLVRAVLVYVVVAWAVVQVADVLFPALQLPSWSVTLVVALALVGLPLVLVLEWVFVVTSQGGDELGAEAASSQRPAGRRSPLGTMVVGALAFSVLAGATLAVRSTLQRSAGGEEGAVKSIAVLPLETMGGEPEDAYFSGGIHEDILTRLAKVEDLKVISRTSVLGYRPGEGRNLREIGRELGVATILEGSVRRSGNRVVVTAQLIDAHTDEHIWAERYERNITDVFTIQAAIAEEIARALQAELSAEEQERINREPTRNPDAYNAFLRGLEHTNRSDLSYEDLAAAEELYSEAVHLDPDFAAGWARLSMAHSRVHWFAFDRSPERVEMALAAAERALDLDPGLPEAHLALGLFHYRIHRDYDRALHALEIARQGLPGSGDVHGAIGWVQRRMGQHEEAIASLARAVELDPRNPSTHVQLGFAYRLARAYPEAARSLSVGLALAPDDYAVALNAAELYLSWQGTTDSLRTLLARLEGAQVRDPTGRIPAAAHRLAMLERRPHDALEVVAAASHEVFQGTTTYHPQGLLAALAHEALGDRVRQRAALDSARVVLEATLRTSSDDPRVHASLGLVYAGLGRKEDAIAGGRRATELLPESEDAWWGPGYTLRLAEIFARVAEPDSAFALVEHVLSIPSNFTDHNLRLEPRWAALHDDERFNDLLRRFAVR